MTAGEGQPPDLADIHVQTIEQMWKLDDLKRQMLHVLYHCDLWERDGRLDDDDRHDQTARWWLLQAIEYADASRRLGDELVAGILSAMDEAGVAADLDMIAELRADRADRVGP